MSSSVVRWGRSLRARTAAMHDSNHATSLSTHVRRAAGAEARDVGAARRGAFALERGVALDQLERVLAREDQQLRVPDEVRRAQFRDPVLARAEELAGAADAQVLLGDAEAVVRGAEH